MPGFGTGLLGAVAAGATGYAQGEEAARREALQLAIQRRQQQRDEERQRLEEERLQIDRDKQTAANVIAGYTPASTHLQVVASADKPPMPDPINRPFGDRMQSMGAEDGLPAAPARDPFTVGPAPSIGHIDHVTEVDTPASYDPMAGQQGALTQARLDGAASGRAATIAAAADKANKDRASREKIAALRAANRQAGQSGPRPMTANAKEKNARDAAKGLLAIHGDADATKEWLASPDGAEARAQGMTPLHIDIAAGLRQEGDTRSAITGARTMSPERSAKKVQQARTLMQPRPAQRPAPATGEPTDAEIDAAIAAGVSPDDGKALRAHIAKMRGGRS